MTKTTKATKATKTTKTTKSTSQSARLRGWTSAAAESLSKQGQHPIPVGRRGNSLAWRDSGGDLHTLVLDWYDGKASCVRLYIDHYTLTDKMAAKALGCKSASLPPSSVRSHVEITTTPHEMDAALVWALTGRSGTGPCAWWVSDPRYFFSQAADAAYRASWPQTK